MRVKVWACSDGESGKNERIERRRRSSFEVVAAGELFNPMA